MTFTANRMMLRAMPNTAVVRESRAQSRSVDSSRHPPSSDVQRARVAGLPVDGRDGPDDVLSEPQQDEDQLRVRFRSPGDSGAATHVQRQEVVEESVVLTVPTRAQIGSSCPRMRRAFPLARPFGGDEFIYVIARTWGSSRQGTPLGGPFLAA